MHAVFYCCVLVLPRCQNLCQISSNPSQAQAQSTSPTQRCPSFDFFSTDSTIKIMKLNNHKMKTVNIQRFRRGLRQPQPLSGSHDRFAICIVDDGLAPILPVRACWGGGSKRGGWVLRSTQFLMSRKNGVTGQVIDHCGGHIPYHLALLVQMREE